jgi:formylglycine-generating enzyme required for sulfatase activity/tRNA A-37 threonylcarbamoyl transferase component Bud32
LDGIVMSKADAERSLLFGLVALQMDLISRDALVAGLNAWVLRKHTPLGQVLVEQGALSAPRRDLLESLVNEHIAAHGDDPARSLATIESAGSARRELETVADPDLQASLAHVTVAGTVNDDPFATRLDTETLAARTASGAATTSEGGRFRVIRFHAKGGLGRVSVALDQELGREVALKEIQDHHADHPDSRARFRLEAEITGRLEHPGIIPVYGLGHDPSGRPYYAMRFIRGDNLHDAIRRFHDADGPGRDPGERALAFRELLRRFVDVCNAVAYAHSRGVLHRDLKPGNVMLGPYGQTLVVDWGLAKLIGSPGEPQGAAVENPLQPSAASEVGATQAGSRVGTIGFMSPEQAEGRLDELGPASDVYSLGATLYPLLTGRAAFEGRDPAGVLARVLRGEFPAPRQVGRGVPKALEAVCLKAMALKPKDRYATPRAFADDVERWVADEPVTAWREPWTTRVRRWAGRHRTAVTATATALLVALLALVAYTSQRLADARRRVDALTVAEVRAIPSILEQLGADRRLVRDRLARLARGDGRGADDRRRLPAALALLPDDPGQADFLAGRMLKPEATPDEVLVIRDALIAQHLTEKVSDRLRRVLTAQPKDLDDAQLRAAGALAKMAPADPAWPAVAGPITRRLVRENPLWIGPWGDVFRPMAGRLAGPLRDIYAGRGAAEQRDRAFTLLFEFAAGPDDVVALIGAADPDQFRQLLGRLGTPADRDRAVALLAPKVREPARFDDELGRRQGRWAMALLRLGRPEAVWPLFRHTDDPSLRTELIHELRRFGFDPAPVVARLRAEPDASARRALILCLGEFAPELIAESDRRSLADHLQAQYATDPDPGLHGAIDWLLRRRWGRAKELARIDGDLARSGPPKGCGWYVNRDGQTFTILRDPPPFLMGSTARSDPDREPDEAQHRRRIGRSYAIATREVTLAEYARFLDAKPSNVLDWRDNDQFKRSVPSPDCAVGVVTWYEAALYCNWLSAREQIPADQWCYPAQLGAGMTLPANYLERTGYRLPTEAEWEYACRAGAASSRFYGRSEEWLGEYGWFQSNSGRTMHPAGRLKPNDLGLFDILGGIYEWCSEAYLPAIDGKADVDDLIHAEFSDDVARALRGGSFIDSAVYQRSADRGRSGPLERHIDFGFRLVRTYP